ncbi:MAG: mannose-1-phosphate guanylyltransferase [Candidatus Bipolaricaulia bacterium]
MDGVFALIMAGGSGRRLYPLSRKEFPKQFLDLTGEGTLLQNTAERLRPLIPPGQTYVVTEKQFAEFVSEQLPELPAENLITEPVGRNTAPAIGLAAIRLKAVDPQGIMVVLPADHVIKRREMFLNLLKAAIRVARDGTHLVTLGIHPDHPATGYGYIEYHPDRLWPDTPAYPVRSFTEKPDRTTAQEFLSRGNFLWNSGMFIWRIDTILREIQTHLPDVYDGLMEIDRSTGVNVLETVYRGLERISVDYGVMERAGDVVVIPAEIGWNDVGDWSAMAFVHDPDEADNVVHGKHVGIDTQGSVIYGNVQKTIVTIGVEGLVIVDTEDVLLIADRERIQAVREIAERLDP